MASFAVFDLTQPKKEPPTEEEIARQKAKEEEQRQLELCRQHYAQNPDMYCKFPTFPKKKFIVSSELMHKLIFKALQAHLEAIGYDIDKLFTVKPGKA